MLAMALLPALSHALAASLGTGIGSEVCTTRGKLRLALADSAADPAAPTPAVSVGTHSPCCLPSAGTAGMPPAPMELPQTHLPAHEVPPEPREAPRPHFAWPDSQPRGPPAGC